MEDARTQKLPPPHALPYLQSLLYPKVNQYAHLQHHGWCVFVCEIFFPCFIWQCLFIFMLCNIPICEYPTIYLPIVLLLSTWAGSMFPAVMGMPPRPVSGPHVQQTSERNCWVVWHERIQLYWSCQRVLYKVSVWIYTPISSVWEFHLLHILANTWS